MSKKNPLGLLVGIVALATGCSSQPAPRVAESSMIGGESIESILASTSLATGAVREAGEAASPAAFGSSDYEVSFRSTEKTYTSKQVAVSVPLQSSFLSKRERLQAAEAPVVTSTTW